jgi:hypothetical protein
MFDFLKPEVSGIKNVLSAYDAYAQSIWGRPGGGIMPSMMRDFSTAYFRYRFGPPFITNPTRSINMINIAEQTNDTISNEYHGGQVTIYSILVGMMTAENIRTDRIDFDAIRRILSKNERRLLDEIIGF